MKRFLLVVVAIVAAGACNKPAMDDCRQAVEHVRVLYGTDNIAKNGDNEAEVRRCRGGSSKEAVACAIKAGSLAELKTCDFMGSKSSK